jgi:predicted regulator of Ras-like GTPase activity (Roadblock/LC7/MglB family)
MVKKNASQTQNPDATPIISTDKDVSFETVAASLGQIRKLKGITGYILRSDTSAIVDLPEQEKLSSYALFSWQIFDSSLSMVERFNMSGIENVLVEGKHLNVLCMNVGDNKVSIFMDKTANSGWIVKRIKL